MTTARIELGDCIERMAEIPAASIDAIVTDPPYGLGFMGKEWDQARDARAFQAWVEIWATAALRVLKPGGHLLAFGGTRTYHRLTAGIEDAGFEIRDTIAWLYGSGFPKSLDVSKAIDTAARADAQRWDGWGTALKPAFEPIVVARKPLTGTVAATVTAHGTGALNIDACRIDFRDDADEAESKAKNRHGDFDSAPRRARDGDGIYGADERRGSDLGNYDPPGRWPANVVLDEVAAEQLDNQTGELAPGNHPARREGIGYTAAGGGQNSGTAGDRRPTEAGGASRFFYCAKASRAERNAGLDGFEPRPILWSSGDQNPGSFQSEGTDRAARNPHPTVKPIELMRWLVRLVTPPAGLVLDPFVGSGTTGCAAVLEARDFLGFELDADYHRVATARVEWWRQQPPGTATTDAIRRPRSTPASPDQLGLLA